MRRAWTTDELSFLSENAGVLTKKEIAERLGRTPESVAQAAKRLNRQGAGVSLRKPYSGSLCPSCGCERLIWTQRGKAAGMCRICEKKAQIATVKARMAKLAPRLSPEDRAAYARTEAQTQSSMLPKPKPKPKPKRSARKTPAKKAREERKRKAALEAWEVGCLHRELRAAQKRKERMEKKCRT